MAILSKSIYTFNIISTKIPMAYLIELEQIVNKFICNQKKDPE